MSFHITKEGRKTIKILTNETAFELYEELRKVDCHIIQASNKIITIFLVYACSI